MKCKRIEAAAGKWLTNGDTFGKTVTLPNGADATVWREITDEEKQLIEEEKNKQESE